jgi:uncharacterized protein YrzB (UPF0473 family)
MKSRVITHYDINQTLLTRIDEEGEEVFYKNVKAMCNDEFLFDDEYILDDINREHTSEDVAKQKRVLLGKTIFNNY